VSRMGAGGSGFFGFLLRWIVTGLIVWLLTVVIAAAIMMVMNVSVDLVGSFLQPLRVAENNILLGAGALLLGWIISMLIAYLVVWRGVVFA